MQNTENTLSHVFKSTEELRSAFMPFVQDGGIFLPTQKKFPLSAIVQVKITLPKDEKTHEFDAEVIWITPEKAGTVGIGVRCQGDSGEQFQKIVRSLLSSEKENESSVSQTM